MPARVTPRLACCLVTLVALGACGGDGGGDAARFDVALGRFVIEPATLTVPAGAVELRVTNTDTMVHDLVVASKGTRPLQPGESYDLPLGDIATGEYRMWCDQPGHAEAGQTGVLVVTPPPG